MRQLRCIYVNIYFSIAFLLAGCSNDGENSQLIRKMEGVLLGQASCNTESNGLAYRVDVDDFESVEFIITPNLLDEFKQDGRRIQFDMIPGNEGITFCTNNYFPNQFYLVLNVAFVN
jgi:hypothetical protein